MNDPSRYLVIFKFESEEQTLDSRIREHVPIIKEALIQISSQAIKPEPAFNAKDGSILGLVVFSSKTPQQILSHLHSPRDGLGSPTRTRDQIAIIEIGREYAIERIEWLAGWLSRTHKPAGW